MNKNRIRLLTLLMLCTTSVNLTCFAAVNNKQASADSVISSTTKIDSEYINQLKNIGIKNIFTTGKNIFFIKNDGSLWGIGSNSNGELGIGNTEIQNTPVRIEIDNVKTVISGISHTFFITTDNKLFATGDNSFGQLGTGDFENRTTPVEIDMDNVKQVVCGDFHTTILKNDGSVYATGFNEQGELGIGSTENQNIFVKANIEDVEEVFYGGYHTIYKKTTNEFYVTGNNSEGQLGLGHNKNQLTPVKLNFDNIKTVQSGAYFTLITTESGEVFATGSNDYGQLALGDTVDRNSFEKVNIDNVKKVRLGYAQTIFLTSDNKVYVAGGNTCNQLSKDNLDVINLPTEIKLENNNSPITNIYPTHSLTLVQHKNGDVSLLGKNISQFITDNDVEITDFCIKEVNKYWLYDDYKQVIDLAIESAKKSIRQEDIDIAFDILNKCDFIDEYEDYLKQLNELQNSLNEELASQILLFASQVEINFSREDLNAAKELLSTLSEKAEGKEFLAKRLESLDTLLDNMELTNAQNSLEKAELKLDKKSIATAEKQIKSLEDGNEKEELLVRLNSLQSESQNIVKKDANSRMIDSKSTAEKQFISDITNIINNVLSQYTFKENSTAEDILTAINNEIIDDTISVSVEDFKINSNGNVTGNILVKKQGDISTKIDFSKYIYSKQKKYFKLPNTGMDMINHLGYLSLILGACGVGIYKKGK